MTLRDSIERYIAWRRAHGAKFVTSAGLLHCFSVYAKVQLDVLREVADIDLEGLA